MMIRTLIRAGAGLVLLALLTIAAGCGPNYKARGTVTGKVTIDGKHLTAGTVMFYGKDPRMTGAAPIDKNGNYKMTDAPLGDVKITVTVPPTPPGGTKRMKTLGGAPTPKKGKGKEIKSVDPEDPSRVISIMGDMPDEIVGIPDLYGKVETSGLTFTVKSGEQTHDIPLTKK